MHRPRPARGTVDSPVAARLREHGLVLLGKTTTPELAWKGVTDSPLDGVTRNPWDPARTSGGSSGGSAAAVAAGMGAAVRGHRRRRLRAHPGLVLRHRRLQTHGRTHPAATRPARSALLAARGADGPLRRRRGAAVGRARHAGPPRPLLAAAVVRHLPRSRASRRPRAAGRLFAPLSATSTSIRRSPQLVASVVAVLGEAGLTVEEADPGFTDPIEAFEVLWSTGAAKWLDSFPEGSGHRVDPGLRRVWERGRTYSARDYLDATAERMALGIHMGEFHTHYDVLLTPTMPVQPFEVGHDVPPGSGLTDWPQWTGFTYPFNMTQQPAVSVPAGFTSQGLPVGLQIVGPRHSDDLVLAVARLVEELRPWPTGRPTRSRD